MDYSKIVEEAQEARKGLLTFKGDRRADEMDTAMLENVKAIESGDYDDDPKLKKAIAEDLEKQTAKALAFAAL